MLRVVISDDSSLPQVCLTGGVDPATIVYIEAHGTGTVAGDGQELSAVDSWYGRAAGRKVPVLIGSVKSNMGHCEGASGLAGATPQRPALHTVSA